MAKKKNTQQINAAGASAGRKPAAQPAQQAKQKAAPQAEKVFSLKPPVQAMIVAGIAVLTWLFLKECLNNVFTNWDDPGYVLENSFIKNISPEGIQNIFSFANPVMGNYHPLTILSYAIEYSYVRLEPWQYHFDSLVLHIVVTMLVYWFVSLLTRRPVAAAVAALLFGLHPMHVESVAWVAGRKDLLYAFFYIAACTTYVYSIRAVNFKKWALYLLVLILFLCSLLAKPVAVSLPLALLVIAWFDDKLFIALPGEREYSNFFNKYKLNKTAVFEIIPFLAIAVIFGIKSINDQKTFGALGTLDVNYNPLERIALGCYALVTYLWKALVPAGLSCFYPYPEKADGVLPWYYYGYILAVAAIIFVVWKFARKSKPVLFGLLFFMVNIGLLLQFIPVGGAILADRYAYIPYLGLFIIAGWYVAGYFEPGANRQTGYLAAGVVLVYSLALGYTSSERCKAWYNAVTLWNDEIEKHPHTPNAYNNLGFNYFNKFSDATDPKLQKLYYDSSFTLLNRAIELQPNFVNPYISLGELERSTGQFPEAKKNYYKALSLKSNEEDANAYLGLAIIYAITQKFDSSAYCFRTALQLKPYFPEAHSNYGNFMDMTGKYDSSLHQYGIAIAQDPDMYAPYLNRGRALQRKNRCDEAMKDFQKALDIKPDMGELYYARSYCYTQKGDKTHALQDVERALSLGFMQIDQSYYAMLKAK